LRASAIASHRASGFGPQIQGSSHVEAGAISRDGAEIGRAIKFAAAARGDLADLTGTNSGMTGIAWSIGTYRCNARHIAASGNRGRRYNAVGFWFSDQWNRDNALSEVRSFANATADIAVYPSDTGNSLTGVATTVAATILNWGRQPSGT
jgi:hypothetical protein